MRLSGSYYNRMRIHAHAHIYAYIHKVYYHACPPIAILAQGNYSVFLLVDWPIEHGRRQEALSCSRLGDIVVASADAFWLRVGKPYPGVDRLMVTMIGVWRVVVRASFEMPEARRLTGSLLLLGPVYEIS